MILEIHVLVCDRHENEAELNRLPSRNDRIVIYVNQNISLAIRETDIP
jgi:hypothetical protein